VGQAGEPKWPFPLEKINGRDEPGEVRPRIDVDASLTAKLLHQLRVYDAKVEAELVSHLISPLELKPGRADDDVTGAGAAASPWAGNKKRRATGPTGFARVRVVEDRQGQPAGEAAGSEPIRLRLGGGRELVGNRRAKAMRIGAQLRCTGL